MWVWIWASANTSALFVKGFKIYHIRHLTCIQFASLQARYNCTHTGLWCHARHGVYCYINNICSCLRTSQHRSHTCSCSIMCMDVYWNIWMLISQSCNQKFCCSWFQQASHILKEQNCKIYNVEFIAFQLYLMLCVAYNIFNVRYITFQKLGICFIRWTSISLHTDVFLNSFTMLHIILVYQLERLTTKEWRHLDLREM